MVCEPTTFFEPPHIIRNVIRNVLLPGSSCLFYIFFFSFALSPSLALSRSLAFFSLPHSRAFFLSLKLVLCISHSLALSLSLSLSLAHIPSFESPLALVFGRLVPSLSQEIYPFVSLQVRKTTELVFGGKRKKQH